MGQYGNVAVEAYQLCIKGTHPVDAWFKACEKQSLTPSEQEKGCPKNTFLGLCEEGFVKGVAKGHYTKSVKNKAYGLKAVAWLFEHPNAEITPKKLWEEIGNSGKKHNQQMDVVIALWDAGLMEKKV
jgi:hypothetical protein